MVKSGTIPFNVPSHGQNFTTKFTPFSKLQYMTECNRRVDPLAWFSLECRKVIGFESTSQHDKLKKLAPLFPPIKRKTTPAVTRSHAFSRASHLLSVLNLSFDLFIGLSVSFVIGQSDYIGFGFTTLNENLP